MAGRIRFGLLLFAVVLFLTASVGAEDAVLAECWQGLSSDGAAYQECPLGDYAADTLRIRTGAQCALVPAGLLGEALVGDGQITESDLTASFPEDCPVMVTAMSVPDLRALLEQGVKDWTLTKRETLDPGEGSGDFLQISGLLVTYDASAPAGQRVTAIELSGKRLPLEDGAETVTAAVPEALLPAGSGGQGDLRLRALMRDRLLEDRTTELPEDGRMRVIGAHQRELISYVPPGLLAVILLLALMGALLSRGRKTQL